MKTIIPMHVLKVESSILLDKPGKRILRFKPYDLGKIDQNTALTAIKLGQMAIAFEKEGKFESLEISENVESIIKLKNINILRLEIDDKTTFDVDSFSKQIVYVPSREYRAYYSITFRIFV